MSRLFHLFRALPEVYGVSVISAKKELDPNSKQYCYNSDTVMYTVHT